MAMKDTLTGIFNTVKRAGLKPDYLSSAIKGGAIGAGIGGINSMAQGGSFFDGAYGGAMSGAAIGAGYKAYKVGTGKSMTSSVKRSVVSPTVLKKAYTKPTVINMSENAAIARNVKDLAKIKPNTSMGRISYSGGSKSVSSGNINYLSGTRMPDLGLAYAGRRIKK